MAFPEHPSDASSPGTFGLFWGQVTDTADPEKRGRVRAIVPGLLEPQSPWLLPVGMPGAGSAQRGMFAVPPVQATVLVGFIQGDVDEGVYWAGPPGAPGGVTDIPTTPAGAPVVEAPQHVAYETERFEIVITDTPLTRRILILNKRNRNFIEMNDDDNTITLSGTHINLLAEGQIDIRGGVVTIQGQQVLKLGRDAI